MHLQVGEVVGDPGDAALAPFDQPLAHEAGVGFGLLVDRRRLDRREAVERVVPEAVEEAAGEAHRAVVPVQRLRRPRRVEDRQPHGVGAVAADQLVGVDDVAEVLAHLAPVGDDHLVEEAAGEGLAVLEEGEGADVAQRLGHGALVEDEAAAVVAGDEALGGQPLPQVGVAEHLLGPVLRRHRGRDPEPERVEVAVEGVGLPLGGLAAARALDVDEVGPLGERVALPGRLDVAGQDHGQILDRHRHRAAARAVDDRDRRAPVALATDREVRGAVALRLARLDRRRAGRRRAAAARGTRAAIASSASSTAGIPRTAVGPKRASTIGETKTGSSPPPGAVERGAGVDHRHRRDVAGAALPAAGAQLVELRADLVVLGPALDLGVARARRGRSGPRATASACGVKTVTSPPLGSARSSSTPSVRPRM